MKKLFFASMLIAISVNSFAQRNYNSETSDNSKRKFGKNILAFNPVHLISNDFVGVGFSYERLVNEYLGVKIPVMLAVNNDYFNIGLEAKLYPTKNTGPVKYAIAPTLMMGVGTSSHQDWTNNPLTGSNSYTTIKDSANHFGFLLNQTLNVTITKQFYIGLEGGIGINYYDQMAKKNNDNNTNISFLAQMNVGLGFRF